METIKTTNNNGYTPKQQQAADAEAEEEMKSIENTNPKF